MVSVARTLLKHYRGRTILGVVLMASQAFVYNAIFFTYALILTKFYNIPADKVGLYILPFAVGNFLGPLLLGPLFDSLGRRQMITATYAISGVLLAVTGWMFHAGHLDAMTQTAMWSVVFFFASAAPRVRPTSRWANASRWKSGRSPSRCSTPSAPCSAASAVRGCSAC